MMDEPPLFPTYKALWHQGEGEGEHRIWVHYVCEDTGEGGFSPVGQGFLRKPEIWVGRSYAREPTDRPSEERGGGLVADLMTELFVLAHEYGHALSWRATPREAWRPYYAALLRRGRIRRRHGSENVADMLSMRDKALVLAEEERAWALARPFIPRSLLAAFSAHAERALSTYRVELGERAGA